MLITFQLPFFHDSIVLASYKDPFPGWVNIKCTNKKSRSCKFTFQLKVDNLNGPTGVIVSILRFVYES